jgi:hypothetical protein
MRNTNHVKSIAPTVMMKHLKRMLAVASRVAMVFSDNR